MKARTSKLLIFKSVVGLFLSLALITLTPSSASVVWVEPGLVGDLLISGEYEYQEYCLITGEAVLLKGTVKLPKDWGLAPKKSPHRYSVSFDLKSEDGGITLERSVGFETKFTYDKNLGQTKAQRKITKISEEYKTPDGTYTLGKFNFLQASASDHTPSITYFSGNLLLERTLYLNGDAVKNEGYIALKTDVRPITGYSHHYGGQTVYSVRTDIRAKKGDDKEWSGYYTAGLSSLLRTAHDYQHTDPQNISFRGSYFAYKTGENSVKLSYTLGKNASSEYLTNKVVREKEALSIPVLRDIGGRPLEPSIKLLSAMGAFDLSKEYFAPTSAVSRHQFAKALYIVIKGRLADPTRSDIVKRHRPGVDTPFLDVSPEAADYHYIEKYKDLGIVSGRNRYLKPDELCTKAEVVTMIVSAMGLNKIAPTPPYKTNFTDDDKIGAWARDSFYMALEVGLITPDHAGRANPNAYVSREEAAHLLSVLINHLNTTITPDYREKIIKK